jgi:peptidoglycan/xylan/chitin deacetylase (PgdA/CDA1 family)
MKNWFNQKFLGLLVKTNGIMSKPLFGGIGHIFMLHRVLPNDLRNEYTFNRDLAITPEFLEQTIIDLKKENYRFISLDELHIIIKENRKLNQKFICLTLDDGYRDNITYGLPVFEKYEIPFTMYITNSFPNKTAHFWWYWLEEKVNRENELTWKNKVHSLESEQQKLAVYNLLRSEIKNSNLLDRTKISTEFFEKTQEQIQKDCAEIALSWNELINYKLHELITIGAHTMNHLSLANLTAEVMMSEIENGKLEMEEKLGFKIDHFAYPYGSLDDAGKREFDFVRQLKFKTATLNHPGNVFSGSYKSRTYLPRYPLGNNTNKEKLSNYLNGIQHFSTNGWKRSL